MSAQAAPVVVLRCSPRVAPGLLTAEAWDVVRAGRVFSVDPAHPQLGALRSAGVEVNVVAPDELARSLVPGSVLLLGADAPNPLAGQGFSLREVVGSYDLPGAHLLDAVSVMDRLRAPGGCPWDAEQTHMSLAPYLIEEAYEAYQALEDGEHGPALADELGDVLMQVLFHARVAQESAGGWDVDAVADALVDKLVRRHPHVFASTQVSGAAEVEANWDAIKAGEGRTSVVDGVALGQPALSLATKLLGRATKAGLPTSLPEAERDATPAELLGRALFGLAARAKSSGVDPEGALRTVARSYADQLRDAEG